LRNLTFVFLGGGLGSCARYLVGGWFARTLGPAFPYGTLAINASGSFLLGALMVLSLETNLISPELRIALAVGVLGGFTTYSTFNYETLALFEQGAWFLGTANVLLTVFVCLGAGGLALVLAKWALAG
jgi:CrcB protein